MSKAWFGLIRVSICSGDFIKKLRQDECRAPVVLDLCCGKGGDLLKWKLAGVGELIMTGMLFTMQASGS